MVGLLGEWLAGVGLFLYVVCPFVGDAVFADLRGCDGLFVLGGGMVVNDELMVVTCVLLWSVVVVEVLMFGVCFGAQLFAVANGGWVEQNPDGLEIGAFLVVKWVVVVMDLLFGLLFIMFDVI